MSEETIQRLSKRAASRIRDGFTPESIIADTLNIQHDADAKAHAAEVERLTKERDAFKAFAKKLVDASGATPLDAEHYIRVCRDERDQLRTDLAAAIVERDGSKQNEGAAIENMHQLGKEFREILTERDQLRQRVAELETGMGVAWGVIANASKGNWHHESEDWQDAAADWRDNHWHKMLSTKEGDEPSGEFRAGDFPPGVTTASEPESDFHADYINSLNEEAGATPETVHQQLWRVSKERDAALAQVAILTFDRDAFQRDAITFHNQRDEARAQADSDAKEIAELKAQRDEMLAINIEARERADLDEAACAAMRESIAEFLMACGSLRHQLPLKFHLTNAYQDFVDACEKHKSALATDSGKALLDRLAAAEADTKRLDFVLSILQKHGVMGFLAHAWSNDPSDPTFDRAAIDIALNAMQKGTTNE